MSYKTVSIAACVLAVCGLCLGQDTPPKHPFFAFCMDTHDSMKRSLEEQAALLAELGYDGAGHLYLDGLEQRLATLDAHKLRLFQVYFRVNVAPGQTPYDPALREALPLLKGRGVQLALLMGGLPPRDPAGEERGVTLVRELAELTRPFGVKVVLYPHSGDWLETVEDALRVADASGAPDVGVMFNLCHWLKAGAQTDPKPLLEKAMPRLAAVSLHGADGPEAIRAGKGNWIQPLDSGSYDVAGLLKTLDALGYRGPVGLQCYGIEGDARVHLQRSMAAWKKMP